MTLQAEPKAVRRKSSFTSGISSQFSVIWVATILLFIASSFIPGGLSTGAILSMLPFASVLAVAAAGQTLVLQQKGFDFSVAGVFTFSSVVISHTDAGVFFGIISALCVGVIFGLINGLAVTKLGIAPIVATLGSSAIAVGAARTFSGGFSARVPTELSSFIGAKTFAIPNIVLVAVVIIAVLAFIHSKSTFGRRLLLVGSAERAASASGIYSNRYILAAYVLAGVCFSMAGIMYSGFVQTPNLVSGDYYLMATAAVVVLGGTALTGGKASLIASAIGALFLSQLNQIIRALGAPDSVQLLVSGIVLLFAMVLHNVVRIRNEKAVKK